MTTAANSTATRITTRAVIFDAFIDGLAHTRLDCPAHLGLIELVEQHLGAPCDDPDVVEAVAHQHGLVIDAHLVLQARPCAACTLVAAPVWLAAA